MRICDSRFLRGECAGHLSKFDSCEDEALYWMSMEDVEENCGDSDFEGYASVVVVAPGTSYSWGEMDVVVPAGNYVVWTATSGAVAVTAHDTPDAARSAWRPHAERWWAWEHGCNPNDLARHAGCLDYDECQLQCEGHESTDGPIGTTVHCDGTCRP